MSHDETAQSPADGSAKVRAAWLRVVVLLDEAAARADREVAADPGLLWVAGEAQGIASRAFRLLPDASDGELDSVTLGAHLADAGAARLLSEAESLTHAHPLHLLPVGTARVIVALAELCRETPGAAPRPPCRQPGEGDAVPSRW